MAKQVYTLRELAQDVTGGNLQAMAKLVNDAGQVPRLDEHDPAPLARIRRETVIDLAADRAGDVIGRRLFQLLGQPEA